MFNSTHFICNQSLKIAFARHIWPHKGHFRIQ